MKKHLTYLSYLARHKYYVAQECFKVGLYFRGIVHDWSKFLPSEWGPYADFFGTPVDERTPAQKEAFALAWGRHVKRHAHHWQWHCNISDKGEIRAHEMPHKDRLEMLCDWQGAHKALGGTDLAAWYRERRATIPLAPKTKRWIEEQLGVR